MSLLTEAMTDCVFLDEKHVEDGEGATIVTYVESVQFKAAITFDTSIEARIGSKQGVTSRYTVTVPRGIRLSFHDVFRRISDGKIFRVTSDGDDKVTPPSASFAFSQVTAEEWSI